MAIMTIDDALKQILTRVNDPYGDTYWLRAYQLFFEGINTLVQTGEYKAEEIPSMIKIVTLETEDRNSIYWSSPNMIENDLFGGFVIKIIDVRDSVGEGIVSSSEGNRFKEIDNDYYQLIKFDKEYKPLKNEIFYMIEGKTEGYEWAGEPTEGSDEPPSVENEHKILIKFIGTLPRELELKYIASPIPSKFKVSNPADSIEQGSPTRVDQMFSLPFLYKVIDFAVQKLSMEAFD
jgi:hypothetical protein